MSAGRFDPSLIRMGIAVQFRAALPGRRDPLCEVGWSAGKLTARSHEGDIYGSDDSPDRACDHRVDSVHYWASVVPTPACCPTYPNGPSVVNGVTCNRWRGVAAGCGSSVVPTPACCPTYPTLVRDLGGLSGGVGWQQGVGQLVAYLLWKQDVGGSSPPILTAPRSSRKVYTRVSRAPGKRGGAMVGGTQIWVHQREGSVAERDQAGTGIPWALLVGVDSAGRAADEDQESGTFSGERQPKGRTEPLNCDETQGKG